MPPFSPRTLATNGNSFSRNSPASMMAEDRRQPRQHIAVGELVQRGQHGGTAQRIGAPGVGAFAVFEAGEHDRPDPRPPPRARRCPALAQHHDVRLEAVGLISEQVAGPAEVGLDFIEDEDQIVLAGKTPAAVADMPRADDRSRRRPGKAR